MAQTPDEKTYVEIPFIEQLNGIDWDRIEGDIDVPHPRRRAIPRHTQTPEKGLMHDLLTGKVRVNVNTSMENVPL